MQAGVPAPLVTFALVRAPSWRLAKPNAEERRPLRVIRTLPPPSRTPPNE